MKKDIYEELKPEAFNYEDNMKPSMYYFAILLVVFMVGLAILFSMFLWTLIASVSSLT